MEYKYSIFIKMKLYSVLPHFKEKELRLYSVIVKLHNVCMYVHE